jgi:hypothetical protein
LKSKLEIYALAVCFASVLFLIVSASMAGYALFQIATPDVTMAAYIYDKHQSNDAFMKSRRSCSEEGAQAKLSDAEITKQRQESYALALNAEKRAGYQALIHSIIFILVAAIALVLHWLIAKSARRHG